MKSKLDSNFFFTVHCIIVQNQRFVYQKKKTLSYSSKAPSFLSVSCQGKVGALDMQAGFSEVAGADSTAWAGGAGNAAWSTAKGQIPTTDRNLLQCREPAHPHRHQFKDIHKLLNIKKMRSPKISCDYLQKLPVPENCFTVWGKIQGPVLWERNTSNPL